MTVTIDHKLNAKALGLNANEASVLAAITKCSQSGKGWFADIDALTDALEFSVSSKTVSRAIKKLIEMGLVEKRQNVLYAQTNCPQSETNCPENRTNCPSPYNPLIINNKLMEREKTSTHVPTHDAANPVPTFLDLRKEFSKKGGGGMTTHMEMQANQEWNRCSDAKKIKLLEALSSGAHFKSRLDWLIADFPEPEPEFLRGDEKGPIVQVRYNDRFKLCSPETAKLFNLTVTNKNWK